ncbi:tRNA pseudouridine synthase B [Buchnera aphidicola (Pterocallis alni)]|uniref:tRNA pseudouridine(55) synthase TruB n=1 Tax=Buchnera aphidicola TaxID=9 RepID=UPI003464694D
MYKNIHGILLLDKPSGISSNNILQQVKKILGVKKVGYSGTLDPLATGLLPIFFGKCTKFIDNFINSDKSYHVIMKLGQITSTYDSEGIILEERIVNFSSILLYNSLKKLQSRVTQVAPMYSAVKYKGLPLYKYIRKILPIIKITKNIRVYKIHCIWYNNQFIKLKIFCSKGTYIRSFVHDLGKLLGCGAHVIYLRRIQVASYMVNNCITFKKLYYLHKLYSKLLCITIINQFFIPIQKIFLNCIEVKLNSLLILSQKNIKFFTSLMKNNIVKIIVINHTKKFFIGRIDQYGQLISYKSLNININLL